MLKWILSLFKTRSLEAVLDETRKIKVSGVVFTIRKINPLHYLDGSKIIQQQYDIYKSNKEEVLSDVNSKKMKEFFSQFLVASVVHPNLSLKDDGSGIYVEKMFVDWDMCMKLYSEVMLFTYGKKKLQLNTLAEKKS